MCSETFLFTYCVSCPFKQVDKNLLKSVVVKLNNLQGAILAISKRINDDNSISYVGRIINEQYADGYELKQDVNGNYFLNKIKTDDLIQDHQ